MQKNLLILTHSKKHRDLSVVLLGDLYSSKNNINQGVTQHYKNFGISMEIINVSSLDITHHHYKKVQNMLQKRNITYFAMQYPTLNISILDTMLIKSNNTILVSNQANFINALKKNSYDELFTDKFGHNPANKKFVGNYGHTTKKGHYLIAKNIANSILNHLNITE